MVTKQTRPGDEPLRRDEYDSFDELREKIAELCGAHSNAIVQHGTWMLVAGEMLASIAAHLPAQTRSDVASMFRQRIERLLALGDDDGLPSIYVTELVKEVNRYLAVLVPNTQA